MIEEDSTKLEAIKDIAVELVKENWEQSQKVLLLARLGQALSRRGYHPRAYFGRGGLASFISRELADKVVLLPSPSDALVFGLVPAYAVLDADKGKYFSFSGGNKLPPDGHEFVAQPSGRGRIHRALWAAFSRSLGSGMKRVIQISPPIRFHDIDETATVDSDCLQIPSELIIPRGNHLESEWSLTVCQNIENWIKSSGVSPDSVITKEVPAPPSLQAGDSVLAILVSSLSQEDLRRVVLPLDVVSKLMKRQLKRQ